jgi:hypothetical protein
MQPRPGSIPATIRKYGRRVSRIDALLDGHAADMRSNGCAVRDWKPGARELRYTSGSCPNTDKRLFDVLHWQLPVGFELIIKERTVRVHSIDDVMFQPPGVSVPFRSLRGLKRAYGDLVGKG